MVEYAVLLILLVTLFVGGAEIGMATLASYKNTDAAKTGISEYVEVNQRRLNILNLEKQYLLNLKSICANVYVKDSDNDQAMDFDSNGFKCSVDGDYRLAFTDYIQYLDFLHDEDPVNGLLDYALRLNSDGTFDDFLSSYDIDADNFLSDDELLAAEEDIRPLTTSDETELQNKYSKLLLIHHLFLSRLPLDVNGISLSQAHIAIADHSLGTIEQPYCDGTDIRDGLSNRYIYREYFDNVGNKHIYQTGSVLYLFNPLPIDVASCQSINGGVSKLVAGFAPPQSAINSSADFENNFIPGLPKLNQAMYGMYKRDLNGNLIPPGKMCIEDECPNVNLIDGNIGPSGYFRWNKGSDGSGANDLFKYTINDVDTELLNGFRPTMQIDCSINSNSASSLINDANCQDHHSKVRVHTRYRKLFEGFLTFGLQELNITSGEMDDALKLFYNPMGVGVSGSKNLVGSVDSEIGPLGRNGLPTVKQFKDFRGCYEVDVETNQVSACN